MERWRNVGGGLGERRVGQGDWDSRFDILYVTDCAETRLSALAVKLAEIDAAIASGLSCGLLPTRNRRGAHAAILAPALRRLCARGLLTLAPPGAPLRADVVHVLEGATLRRAPTWAPRIAAGEVWLGPMRGDAAPCDERSADDAPGEDKDAGGASEPGDEADLARAAAIASAVFRAPLRALSVEGAPDQAAYRPLAPASLIAGAPRPAPAASPLIGLLRLDPEADLSEEMRGAGERLQTDANAILFDCAPHELSPLRMRESDADAALGGSEPPSSPFDRLDVLLALDPIRSPEAHFAIALAAAMGLVVITSEEDAPMFGGGAIGARAASIGAIAGRLLRSPDAYMSQSARALRFARRHASSTLWRPRFDALRPPRAAPASAFLAPRAAPAAPRVLMISSNGVGLGHLTRQLAAARRLPKAWETRFLTMSRGAGLVAELGFGVDYAPSFYGLDSVAWNRMLSRRLVETVRRFKPNVVVFDGNSPYVGLLDVLDAAPEIGAVWIRRALWRRGDDEDRLERERHFDVVLEPMELCGSEDVGSTVDPSDKVVTVEPVLYLDAAEVASRAAARAELGVGPGDKVVALQLGAGSNFNLTGARSAIMEALRGRENVRVFQLISPIQAPELQQTIDGAEPLRAYPSARLIRGFDLLVSGAGYNAFHEAMLYGARAVFVPNEAPEMDDQLLRARFGALIGRSATLRAHEGAEARALFDRMLETDFAGRPFDRLPTLPNGAVRVASIIEELAATVPAGAPLADVINRI